MGLNISSPTHDAALTKIFHILANSLSPTSIERFGKSAFDSFVAMRLTVMELKD
jgi:hypothetical protein